MVANIGLHFKLFQRHKLGFEMIWIVALLVLGAVIYVLTPDDKGNKPPPNPIQSPKTPKPTRTAAQTNARKRLPVREPDHAPPPGIPTSRNLKGKAWVIDGDTIVVDKIKIRLAGIDAPELDQPWGQKSKWEMVRLCKGHVIDVDLTGETSYDRLVGTCYLPDGRDLGAEIIKAGLALDGGHFSKGKYRRLEDADMRKKLKRYGHWRKS